MAFVERPVDRAALPYTDDWLIITYPAFRLGLIDAQSGRPIDHDDLGELLPKRQPKP